MWSNKVVDKLLTVSVVKSKVVIIDYISLLVGEVQRSSEKKINIQRTEEFEDLYQIEKRKDH